MESGAFYRQRYAKRAVGNHLKRTALLFLNRLCHPTGKRVIALFLYSDHTPAGSPPVRIIYAELYPVSGQSTAQETPGDKTILPVSSRRAKAKPWERDTIVAGRPAELSANFSFPFFCPAQLPSSSIC